jgi:hypothetical protein
MFGKQSMQVVSLNDLTEFVKGVFPAALQPAQPQYMPQPQQPSGTTTVTIYIQELHIHRADGWPSCLRQARRRLIHCQSMRSIRMLRLGLQRCAAHIAAMASRIARK